MYPGTVLVHANQYPPSQCLGPEECLSTGHMRGHAIDLHGSAAPLLLVRSIPIFSTLSFQAVISSAHCYSSVYLNIVILGEEGAGEQHAPLPLSKPSSLAYLLKPGPNRSQTQWVRQIIEEA